MEAAGVHVLKDASTNKVRALRIHLKLWKQVLFRFDTKDFGSHDIFLSGLPCGARSWVNQMRQGGVNSSSLEVLAALALSEEASFVHLPWH